MKGIKDLLGFLTLSSFIFAIIFGALNFGAIKNIISPYIFSEKVKKEEKVLKKIVEINQEEQKLLKLKNLRKKEIEKEYPEFDSSISSLDFRIIIPKISVNAPIINVGNKILETKTFRKFEEEIQGFLKKGIVHYPGTANPGESGNLFLTGHSSYYPWDNGKYKDIFARLGELELGDVYFVFKNQKKHTYKVVGKKEINPKNISVLNQPKNEKISTLMTCTPVGTTLKRLIITSEEV